jgi:UrcA family protein
MLANSTSKIFRGAILGLATLSMAAVSAPAFASNAGDIEVKISKSELVTSEGRKRVYKHLQHVANEACFLDGSRVSISQKLSAEKCAADLLETLVAQTRDARIAAIHTPGATLRVT